MCTFRSVLLTPRIFECERDCDFFNFHFMVFFFIGFHFRSKRAVKWEKKRRKYDSLRLAFKTVHFHLLYEVSISLGVCVDQRVVYIVHCMFSGYLFKRVQGSIEGVSLPIDSLTKVAETKQIEVGYGWTMFGTAFCFICVFHIFFLLLGLHRYTTKYKQNHTYTLHATQTQKNVNRGYVCAWEKECNCNMSWK